MNMITDPDHLWSCSSAELIEIAHTNGRKGLRDVRRHLGELCEALDGQAMFSLHKENKMREGFTVAMEHEDVSKCIMDFMAITGLSALQFVLRKLYPQVQEYMRSKLSGCTAPFEIDAVLLTEALKRHEAIIIGSVALQAAAPSVHALSPPTIDIVVQENEAANIIQTIAINNLYALTSSSNGWTALLSPVTAILEFTKYVKGREMKIRFLAIDSTANVFEPMFKGSSTLTMNAITGHGVFSAYRRLLSSSSALLIRQSAHNTDDHYQKYQSHGFTFLDDPHSTHKSTLCGSRPECPRTSRQLNDKGTVFMEVAFMIDPPAETTEATEPIQDGNKNTIMEVDVREEIDLWDWDEKNFRGKASLPDVTWRLPNDSGSKHFIKTISKEWGL